MKTRGTRVIDPTLETELLEWLVVSVADCPDELSERRIIARFFRRPHATGGAIRAFVRPVQVRRSRRRVLFSQQIGIDL